MPTTPRPDNTLGCGAGTTRSQVVKKNFDAKNLRGVAEGLVTGDGPYEILIETLRRAVFQGISAEINRIANEAAAELHQAIRSAASKLAVEISSDVSISQMANELTIKVQMPDNLSEIVRDSFNPEV